MLIMFGFSYLDLTVSEHKYNNLFVFFIKNNRKISLFFQKNDGLGVKTVKNRAKKRTINPYLFYFPHLMK